MSDQRSGMPPLSDRPDLTSAAQLKEKRDAFLHTFFKRGAELTDELVQENQRLRDQVAALEKENASLKTQLASDRAIRDLLDKIDALEREKARLLSSVHQQQERTDVISSRYAEIESDLESFANLYVASFQLHMSLRAPAVVRNLKELLQQLVGAHTHAIYFVDEERRNLSPIASGGIDLGDVPAIALGSSAAGDTVSTIVERTVLTGVAHVPDGDVLGPPAACIPLLFEERVVGAIVLYTLLEQKTRFLPVDRELFKLLGAHAGATLVAAHLYTSGDGRLPTPAALRAITASSR